METIDTKARMQIISSNLLPSWGLRKVGKQNQKVQKRDQGAHVFQLSRPSISMNVNGKASGLFSKHTNDRMIPSP